MAQSLLTQAEHEQLMRVSGLTGIVGVIMGFVIGVLTTVLFYQGFP